MGTCKDSCRTYLRYPWDTHPGPRESRVVTGTHIYVPCGPSGSDGVWAVPSGPSGYRDSQGPKILFSKCKSNRNKYFITIRSVKEKYWNTFLFEAHGKDVFTALRYTKPRKCERIRTLQGPSDPTPATTFEGKAKLFHQTVFPPPPSVPIQEDSPAGRNEIPSIVRLGLNLF